MQEERALWCACLILALLLGQCCAIYEDEAGVHDWLLQNVGHVIDADVAPDALLVASPRVLARIEHSSSALLWRQLLPLAYPVASIHRFGDIVVALHAPTAVVAATAWRLSDGALLWEVAEESHCSSSAIALAAEDGDEREARDLLLLCSGRLSIVDCITGSVVTPPSNRRFLATDGRRLLAEAERSGAVVVVTEGKSSEVASGRALLTAASASASAVALLTADSLTVVSDWSGPTGVSLPNLRDRLPPFQSAVEMTMAGGRERVFIAVRFACRSTLLVCSEEKGIEIVTEITHECGRKGFYRVREEGEEAIASLTPTEDGDVLLQLWRAGREWKERIQNSAMAKKSGTVVDIYGLGGEQTMLAVHEDFTLSFIDVGKNSLLWKREESLAHIQSAVMVDALESSPSSLLRATVTKGNVLEMFLTRITGQGEYIVQWISGKSDSESESEEGSGGGGADENVLPPRSERLSSVAERKILVVTTALGTVFGLSTDGEHAVLWKTHFPHQSIRDILQTREAHREQHSLCSLLLKDLATGKFAVVSLSPLSGTVLQRTEVAIDDVTVFALLPFRSPDRSRIILIANDRRQAEIYPDTVATRATVALQESEVFVYRVYENSAEGYALEEDLEGASAFSLLPTWIIPFPSGEVLVAESRVMEEATLSPIRILPNGEPVPKHLNGNLIAFATLAVTADSSSPLSSEQDSDYLTLYVVDAVSGRLLYHAVFDDAAEPISIVCSEHWVATSYWDKKAYAHHLAVVDLYEEEIAWESSARSSFDHVPIQVFDQIYEFPKGIQALAVTQTQRGIANRLLLVGTSSDQVVAVDKRMIDPRRPSAGDKATVEGEGLLPYVPGPLPLNQRSFLSHNHQVQAVRQIRAFPSVLESTSYVVAWGLDVFFAPVFPSEKFDVLQTSFNHFALVVTVSVLLLLTIGSTVMRNRQRLEKKWS